MKTLFCILSLGLFCLSPAAQGKASPEAEAFFQKAMSEINSRHVAWVKNTAKNANEKNLTEAQVKSQASQYGILGSMNDMSIEAMAFLVLMQAARSAQEDLKAIMAKVKSINEQKDSLREAMNKLNNKNIPVTRSAVDSFKLLVQNRGPVQKTTTTVQPVKTRQVAVTPQEIDDLKTQLENTRDSLSEQSEEQQLKMQMVMDRMTKADNAASNMMKKFSEIANSIIQNLK